MPFSRHTYQKVHLEDSSNSLGLENGPLAIQTARLNFEEIHKP